MNNIGLLRSSAFLMSLIYIVCGIFTIAAHRSQHDYERNIVFQFFRKYLKGVKPFKCINFYWFKSNTVVYESKSSRDDLTVICSPLDLWLIVVPGWTDNCTASTAWVPKVIESTSI